MTPTFIEDAERVAVLGTPGESDYFHGAAGCAGIC